MSKDIRDKENELRSKWSLLREAAKNDKIKRKRAFELYEAEDELYKRWKFFKGFLNVKEKK